MAEVPIPLALVGLGLRLGTPVGIATGVVSCIFDWNVSMFKYGLPAFVAGSAGSYALLSKKNFPEGPTTSWLIGLGLGSSFFFNYGLGYGGVRLLQASQRPYIHRAIQEETHKKR